MEVKQSSSFLSSLLRDVIDGRMLPAALQRPYVWRKADVEALFDSMLSEFPIGAFLCWAPRDEADLTRLAKGRLGPILPATADKIDAINPYKLLLDGQNRLATLAWASLQEMPKDFEGAFDAERETWLSGEMLAVDGATASIKFVPADEVSEGLRLPVWTVIASMSGGPLAKAYDLIEKRMHGDWTALPKEDVESFLKFWDVCGQRFRNARVTESVIERATVEEARHAFLRICRMGVPMDQADFDFAVGWLPS